MTLQVDIISLFPEIFEALNHGVCSRAKKLRTIDITHWNPRNYTIDCHQSVDDRPFGGGPGMVMTYPPLSKTLEHIALSRPKTHTIYLSPQGNPMNQNDIQNLAKKPQITLIAGRYAGIDQRIIDNYVDAEYSMGDYILSGGEIPAMALIDAVSRLIPGTLGNIESPDVDSFSNGLLAGPYYTRPAEIHGNKVPNILISGNHKAIAHWKKKESLRKTWQIRPDLIKRLDLDEEQKSILEKIKSELKEED
jgi:tRNA (guanine37-N1)-methyltransferase